jgi:translation initiation factor IF-2
MKEIDFVLQGDVYGSIKTLMGMFNIYFHWCSLHFCVTGDVYGSIEALLGMFSTFDSQLCELRVVHQDVGPVTEADVNLAESLNGKI